jgi:EmrB/QacA subfamily drug resistance transporter
VKTMATKELKSQYRLILWISILASFVAFLDGSIVNVALPAIMRELGGNLALQQWVVDAYLIALGALILIAGSLSDLFGRKRILQWGLLGFGAASLICMVSPDGLFLVFARALQGAAGALLVPSSLALIMSSFPPNAQGKAVGQWTAWTGIAFIIGPLAGGFLVDSFSWRLIFAVNIFPIMTALYLLRLLKQPDQQRATTKVDTLGALLGALGLGGFVYALIEESHYGWTSPMIYVPIVSGILALGIFLWHEHKSKYPMLPLELFKIRNFGVGNAATTAIYAALSVSSFLVVVFLQQVEGYSAIAAGLALLPITIVMFLLSPRIGALSSKYGPRLFMTTGPLVAALGFLYMLRVQTPINYLTELLPGVLLFSLGLSLTVSPLTSAILGSIDSRQAGVGSAINNAVARIAGLMAIATIGIVTGSTITLAGFQRGVILMVILLVIGGVISAIGIQNKQQSEQGRKKGDMITK